MRSFCLSSGIAVVAGEIVAAAAAVVVVVVGLGMKNAELFVLFHDHLMEFP